MKTINTLVKKVVALKDRVDEIFSKIYRLNSLEGGSPYPHLIAGPYLLKNNQKLYFMVVFRPVHIKFTPSSNFDQFCLAVANT